MGIGQSGLDQRGRSVRGLGQSGSDQQSGCDRGIGQSGFDEIIGLESISWSLMVFDGI